MKQTKTPAEQPASWNAFERSESQTARAVIVVTSTAVMVACATPVPPSSVRQTAGGHCSMSTALNGSTMSGNLMMLVTSTAGLAT
eukprot:CAMPEP_0183347464 /NCGR_PEP_ID=MMETSP0164_2-20130417/12282_1 /TAXON_ID=221442 /ORGANISM="Coccolithus pelagicus ssp braarudi, Strain PLY182g" /LENGTH=84 /DNA_ID=CAMNT_0025518891 /DNA_START=379 /DNA_END=629 /DNA_ORIENTATION=-